MRPGWSIMVRVTGIMWSCAYAGRPPIARDIKPPTHPIIWDVSGVITRHRVINNLRLVAWQWPLSLSPCLGSRAGCCNFCSFLSLLSLALIILIRQFLDALRIAPSARIRRSNYAFFRVTAARGTGKYHRAVFILALVNRRILSPRYHGKKRCHRDRHYHGLSEFHRQPSDLQHTTNMGQAVRHHKMPIPVKHRKKSMVQIKTLLKDESEQMILPH
mgnify:CR=1 FL=1